MQLTPRSLAHRSISYRRFDLAQHLGSRHDMPPAEFDDRRVQLGWIGRGE